MSKIKVGDVVTRLAQHRKPHWTQFCHELGRSEGCPLTVTDLRDGFLILEGCDSHKWTPVYFQRVSAPGIPEELHTPKAPDAVNSPKHYASGSVECIEAIKASMSSEAFCGYLKGNVQKYLWRYEKKVAPLEDLHKAQVYLRWLIEENQP
ncbi:nucleotide kinase [Klebsiella phage VLCpiA1e]|nr:nucleotide kinase [Klebsiella phage VLCpiA1e]